jgi:hypothetical protein
MRRLSGLSGREVGGPRGRQAPPRPRRARRARPTAADAAAIPHRRSSQSGAGVVVAGVHLYEQRLRMPCRVFQSQEICLLLARSIVWAFVVRPSERVPGTHNGMLVCAFPSLQ